RPAVLLLAADRAPGSPGGQGLLAALGPGARLSVGPPVPPAEAADSLRCAERGLDLVRRGVLPDRGPLRCAEHLGTLLLYADEPLQHLLRRHELAPLDGLPGTQRARLVETLLAWLQSGCTVPPVARALHVHPQTVRYRLRRLEQLFGDRLRDPGGHLDLELALRAEVLGAARRARELPVGRLRPSGAA
ncbi:PucR family transcriptional regulator, partial [Kitasatospora sp. NPDC058965]|uniref:PucR family transcriptional regulator n=1 Tax=Kitasatospora sp. NPDC058965 TaxID=3346682 RepID=UPI003675D26A